MLLPTHKYLLKPELPGSEELDIFKTVKLLKILTVPTEGEYSVSCYHTGLGN